MKNCNNYGDTAVLLTKRAGGAYLIVSGSPNGVKEKVESERS